MIEKNEVEEIQIFSILDRGKPTGESDAVVFITFNKKEGLTTFHAWDDYTEETDMNEKINEIVNRTRNRRNIRLEMQK